VCPMGLRNCGSGPVCCVIVAHHRRSSHQRVRPVTPAMLAPPPTPPSHYQVVGSRSRSGVLWVRVLGGCVFFGGGARGKCGVVSKMLVSDEDRIPRPWAAFLIFWGRR
jgi:hypothetical protein